MTLSEKIAKKTIQFLLMILFALIYILLAYSNEQSTNFYVEKIYSTKPKIFCLITTQKGNFDNQTKLMWDTWVKKCDNHRFLSVLPKKLIEKQFKKFNVSNGIEMVVNGFNVLQPPGYEIDNYETLTNKIYSTFRYIYQNYELYDWYLKCDDDTFIFMDNLRKFVSNKNTSMLVSYGYDFHQYGGYQSGGAGYLMTRASFELMGYVLEKFPSYCPISYAEDIDVGICLRRLQVNIEKSLDEKGRERFHPLNIKRHYEGNFSEPYDWLQNFAANSLKKGKECCSDETISFHYMNEENEVRIINDFIDKVSLENKNFTFMDIIKLLNY